MKPRRAIQSMLNPSVQFSESIMLLKNGHLTHHRKQTIQTFNTCPFDSVFAMISAMYADHNNIKNQINELKSDSNFLSMIDEMFNGIGKIAIRYKTIFRERNLILRLIFRGEEYDCGLWAVDCNANVNYIIPHLLPKQMYSYYRKKKCDRCKEEITSDRCFVDINLDVFEQQPIQNLNSCLLDTLINEESSPCSCNGTKIVVDTVFSNFIIIDLCLKQSIKLISLCDIPTELNILGITFALKGCIEYIGDDLVNSDYVGDDLGNSNSIGHYISHVYRCNKQWEMYDDKKSKVLRSNTKSKIKGQVLFYVRNN